MQPRMDGASRVRQRQARDIYERQLSFLTLVAELSNPNEVPVPGIPAPAYIQELVCVGMAGGEGERESLIKITNFDCH